MRNLFSEATAKIEDRLERIWNLMKLSPVVLLHFNNPGEEMPSEEKKMLEELLARRIPVVWKTTSEAE